MVWLVFISDLSKISIQ
jgi:hypothetical protein